MHFTGSRFLDGVLDVFELLLALLQFVLNLILCVLILPVVPIVWVIREIKKKPGESYGPIITFGNRNKKV